MKQEMNQPHGTREATLMDYQERLLRVTYYIQVHLDEPLDLDTLARVACFSPFHFHRIFTAYIGESVREYVRRLRLEYAAHKLCHTPHSITDIALGAGYETPAAFTKAFNQHFKVSPSCFRKQRQTLRLPQWQLRINNKPREVTVKPDIRNEAPRKVVYVRRTGRYDKAAQEAWQAVCQYAFSRQLVGPQAEFIGVSYDDPGITPEEKLRYDACITLSQDIKPEGEIGMMTIPGGKYAVFTHVGPYEGLGQVYHAIYAEWVPATGAKLRECHCFEKYLNSPETTKPQDLRTEIFIAVE